jgi:hypothetical protein
VIVLAVALVAGWNYFHSRSTPQAAPASVTAPDPSPAPAQKPAEANSVPIPKPAQGPLLANIKKPAERKKLTYEERAKVLELDSRAESESNDGGCEKALPTYQEVLQIDPGDPRAYAAVQKCYAEARDGGSSSPAQ